MMRTRSWNSRICIRLAAFLLAGGVVGCGESQAPTSPARVADGRTWPVPAAPGGLASAVDGPFPVGPELAALRRATARFHEIARAYAEGYTTEDEPCVASPAGVMGIHAPNPALLEDQAVDPLRPELLLYVPKPNGGYRLVGVEYFQVILLRNLVTQEIAPRSESTEWNPEEYELVNPAPQLFGQTFHRTPPIPTPNGVIPWHWSLHVWVWAHNPAGMFAEWNPTLSCN